MKPPATRQGDSVDFFDSWVRHHIRQTGQPPGVAAIMTWIEANASVRLDHDSKEGTYVI